MKKFVFLLIGVFFISATSSVTTWFFLTRRQAKGAAWKTELHLTPEQSRQFAKMESEFDSTLKELDRDEAQSKIFLCSYLDALNASPDQVRSEIKKMSQAYEQKQERIAKALFSLAGILNPEQRKIFSHKLMQETCESCRNVTKDQQCLCGMCKMKI